LNHDFDETLKLSIKVTLSLGTSFDPQMFFLLHLQFECDWQVSQMGMYDMIFRDIKLIIREVTLSLDRSFNPLIFTLSLLHFECNQKVSQIGHPFDETGYQFTRFADFSFDET
jgi:hypothetical protein